MAGVITDIKDLYARSHVASRYVLWNAGVFLALLLIGFFTNFIFRWGIDPKVYFSLPSRIGEFITQPWSLGTYMFVHEGFIHFIFNMLWLYFGGNIVMQLMDGRKFVKAYWLGGLAGGLLYMVLYQAIPELMIRSTILMGASGSIYAVWAMVAAFKPNYSLHLPLIGPVKLKYVALVFLVINLPQSFYDNTGGHFCHFGGALFGYHYGRNLAAGKDIALWFDGLYERVLSWFEPRKPKLEVVKGGKYSRDDKLYNAQKQAAQEEIDAILDKIGRSGYDSLSKKEKEILKNTGKS